VKTWFIHYLEKVRIILRKRKGKRRKLSVKINAGDVAFGSGSGEIVRSSIQYHRMIAHRGRQPHCKKLKSIFGFSS
jgi:hypothetical protein